jgi:AcrR family transcriptional regulator
VPAGQLSMRAVARAAGISAPAVYLHFADRDQLLAAAVSESWDQLARSLEHAARRTGSQPALERLIAQLRAYLRYALRSPTRYELLFGSSNRLLEAVPFDQSPTTGVATVIVEAVRACEREGLRADGASAEALALHIQTLVHGRIALAYATPVRFGTDAGAIEFIESGVRSLFAA